MSLWWCYYLSCCLFCHCFDFVIVWLFIMYDIYYVFEEMVHSLLQRFCDVLLLHCQLFVLLFQFLIAESQRHYCNVSGVLNCQSFNFCLRCHFLCNTLLYQWSQASSNATIFKFIYRLMDVVRSVTRVNVQCCDPPDRQTDHPNNMGQNQFLLNFY